MEIRLNGVRALIQALGAVEAERFVALINRERFDYTEWRKTQWQDETVASLAAKARQLRAAGQQEPGQGQGKAQYGFQTVEDGSSQRRSGATLDGL